MDFELDDDQLELQRVVRDVVERECPPALVRAVVAGTDDGDGLWKTLVGLDWPSLTVPAEDGGMGLSAVELAITPAGSSATCGASPGPSRAGRRRSSATSSRNGSSASPADRRALR